MTPLSVTSTYSGALSWSSATFSRPSGSASQYYYYEPIQMTISTNGTYIFTSNSSMNTYGYLYKNAFTSYSPSQNLITSDDDSNGDGQFKISLILESGSTYVLIVTTYYQNNIGSFLITAVGPALIDSTWITPSTNPLEMTIGE